MTTPELAALRVYEESGCSPVALVPAADLADEIECDLVYEQDRSIAEWKVCTIASRRRVVLRSGLSTARANWCIAAGLVHLVNEDEFWFRAMDTERYHAFVRDAASWVVAPPEPFRAALAASGTNLRALGSRFTITQTCAAMRIPECGGPSSAVVKDDGGVHRRGVQLSWLDDECLRTLARKPGIKSARRRVITDEPGRVALFARSA